MYLMTSALCYQMSEILAELKQSSPAHNVQVEYWHCWIWTFQNHQFRGLRLEDLRSQTMRRAFFAAVATESGLLCHGGITSNASSSVQRPENDLFLVTSDQSLGETKVVPFNVSNPENGPRLSHHGGILIHDRYFVLVGGWDGRRRTNAIWILDFRERKWLPKPELKVLGDSAPPVGLSGHTVTLLTDNLAAVVGREGGVREQRRFGDVFLLHMDLQNLEYRYEEAPVKGDSRTGHHAIALTNGLLLIGGRQGDPFQFVSWRGYRHQESDCQASKTVGNFEGLSEEPKPFHGMRYFAVLRLGKNQFLLHGGQNFKGRNNVTDELWIMSLQRSASVTTKKLIGCHKVGRHGHKLHLDSSGNLVTVGGFDSTDKVEFIKRICILR